MKKSIVILASGDGSLAQSIMNAVQSGELDAKVEAVVCDQPKAKVLERASTGQITAKIVPMLNDRREWDALIFSTVESLAPDLVVSAGFMRILSPEFASKFRVINAHPALLPLFPGAHAVSETLESGASVAGATIHWVDAGVDTGEIIAQREVEILDSDDVKSLHERIKIVERELIVETIREILPKLGERNG